MAKIQTACGQYAILKYKHFSSKKKFYKLSTYLDSLSEGVSGAIASLSSGSRSGEASGANG